MSSMAALRKHLFLLEAAAREPHATAWAAPESEPSSGGRSGTGDDSASPRAAAAAAATALPKHVDAHLRHMADATNNSLAVVHMEDAATAAHVETVMQRRKKEQEAAEARFGQGGLGQEETPAGQAYMMLAKYMEEEKAAAARASAQASGFKIDMPKEEEEESEDEDEEEEDEEEGGAAAAVALADKARQLLEAKGQQLVEAKALAVKLAEGVEQRAKEGILRSPKAGPSASYQLHNREYRIAMLGKDFVEEEERRQKQLEEIRQRQEKEAQERAQREAQEKERRRSENTGTVLLQAPSLTPMEKARLGMKGMLAVESANLDTLLGAGVGGANHRGRAAQKARQLEVMERTGLASGEELLRQAVVGGKAADGPMDAILRAGDSQDMAAIIKEQVQRMAEAKYQEQQHQQQQLQQRPGGSAFASPFGPASSASSDASSLPATSSLPIGSKDPRPPAAAGVGGGGGAPSSSSRRSSAAPAAGPGRASINPCGWQEDQTNPAMLLGRLSGTAGATGATGAARASPTLSPFNPQGAGGYHAQEDHTPFLGRGAAATAAGAAPHGAAGASSAAQHKSAPLARAATEGAMSLARKITLAAAPASTAVARSGLGRAAAPAAAAAPEPPANVVRPHPPPAAPMGVWHDLRSIQADHATSGPGSGSGTGSITGGGGGGRVRRVSGADSGSHCSSFGKRVSGSGSTECSGSVADRTSYGGRLSAQRAMQALEVAEATQAVSAAAAAVAAASSAAAAFAALRAANGEAPAAPDATAAVLKPGGTGDGKSGLSTGAGSLPWAGKGPAGALLGMSPLQQAPQPRRRRESDMGGSLGLGQSARRRRRQSDMGEGLGGVCRQGDLLGLAAQRQQQQQQQQQLQQQQQNELPMLATRATWVAGGAGVTAVRARRNSQMGYEAAVTATVLWSGPPRVSSPPEPWALPAWPPGLNIGGERSSDPQRGSPSSPRAGRLPLTPGGGGAAATSPPLTPTRAVGRASGRMGSLLRQQTGVAEAPPSDAMFSPSNNLLAAGPGSDSGRSSPGLRSHSHSQRQHAGSGGEDAVFVAPVAAAAAQPPQPAQPPRERRLSGAGVEDGADLLGGGGEGRPLARRGRRSIELTAPPTPLTPVQQQMQQQQPYAARPPSSS